jgi:hypothetical protein
MRYLAICALCVIALGFGTGLNGCTTRYDVEYYVMPGVASPDEVRVAVVQSPSGRMVDVSLAEFRRMDNVAALFR